MADKEISSLPAATSITDADLFVLLQSGAAKKLTGEILRKYAHDIDSASINAQGHLILTLKGGETVDAGTLPAGPGTGDMLASIYDAAQGRKQVAFKTDLDTVKSDLAKAQQSLKNVVNPNLLPNGILRSGCLVNQRGKSSYSGAGYTADGCYISGGTVEVADDYIRYTAPAAAAYRRVTWITDVSGKTGEQYTISCLCDVVAVTGTNTTFRLANRFTGVTGAGKYVTKTGLQIITLTVTLPQDIEQLSVEFLCSNSESNTIDVKVYGVKLEPGDTQTLGHQNASGSWVLNELPCCADTLSRCRYYLDVFRFQRGQVFAGGTTLAADALFFSVPLDREMRAAPTVTYESTTGSRAYSLVVETPAGAAIFTEENSELTIDRSTTTSIMVRITPATWPTGWTGRMPLMAYIDAASNGRLIASAEL